MSQQSSIYRKLCTQFYDNTIPLASNEEIELYTQFFTKNDLILEPMSGSGRVLIPILQAGFKIHGLDNSPSMLAHCKERMHVHNVDTKIFEQSITEMNLKERYDGIIIPFSSFQLLYPRSLAYQSLDNMYQHLKPGGKIIFDIVIPWQIMHYGLAGKIIEKETQLPNGDLITYRGRSIVNEPEQYFTNTGTYQKIINGIIVEQEEDAINFTWYHPEEFKQLLEKHGFKNVIKIDRIIDQEELTLYIAEK